MADLEELRSSLLAAASALQAQSARNAEIQRLIRDVRTVTQGAFTAPAPAAPTARYEASGYTTTPERDCGCSCGCLSDQCCRFEIRFDSVRVLAMQPLELDDSNANPWGELEVKMFAWVDSGLGPLGAIVPSMFSDLSLRKLLQHPAVPVHVNRTIGTVEVPKGKPKTIIVGVDAVESDAGLIERATGGRDEEGSASATMTLDCCCSAPSTCSFDVSFTSGGQGGGAIEVTFSANKRC
jgi:hypothetical protein